MRALSVWIVVIALLFWLPTAEAAGKTKAKKSGKTAQSEQLEDTVSAKSDCQCTMKSDIADLQKRVKELEKQMELLKKEIRTDRSDIAKKKAKKK